MAISLNFILKEMTTLRYFIPLTIEATKRGIVSRYFTHPTPAKYSSPCRSRNRAMLEEYSKMYGFEIHDASTAKDFEGTFFMIEGTGTELLGNHHRKFSITCNDDFMGHHPRYINKVDGAIFPSEYVARHYDKMNPKNLYFGSPKYDVKFDKEKILEKYNIPDLNNVLILSPRHRDIPKSCMEGIIAATTKKGYRTLVKSRGKEPAPSAHRGSMYFEDISWYPHDSIELMKVSQLLINFCSTAIKEATILDVPVLNIDVKPQVRHGIDYGKHRLGYSFLYEQDFCRNLKAPPSLEEFNSAFDELISNDWSSSFSEARKKYLFEGSSSKRILDHIEGLSE